MKKALNLIIMYLITLFLGVVVGTVMYSFYINVLNFVAGTEIKFFSRKELLDAFFYVTFCLLFLMGLFISYYRVRHPGGAAQIITFICLSFLTWAILVPSISRLSEKYVNGTAVKEPVTLSKRYFRQSGDKVYYFTKDFEKNINGDYETKAIVIDTSDEGVVKMENVVNTTDLEITKNAAPYKEILVKNTFHENDFPLAINFRKIIENCEKNINKGILPFIGFLSFGLAISSVFALTCAFHWNLLNTMLITTLTFFILILNSHPELLSFTNFANKVGNGGLCTFMAKFGSEPVLVLVNFLLSFIFIITGIIIFIVRKCKARNM